MLENELSTFLSDDQEGSQHITAYVHTKDKDIKVYKVESLDVVADFTNAYTDTICLVAYVYASELVEHLAPNGSNLEITVLKTTSNETYKMRMKAVIPIETLNALGYNSLSRQTTEKLDITGLMRIELHGKHVFAEAASMLTVSGNYLNTSVHLMLNKVLKYYMSQVRLATGESLNDVVITKPGNAKVYQQLLVPSGTPLLRVPKLIQEKYGVYTSTIGSYLRPFEDGKSIWWIYPTYGNALLTTKVPMLRVFVFYDKKADVLKNTLQRDGNVVIAVATLFEQDNPIVDNRPAIRSTDVTIIDTDRVVENPSTYKTGQVNINGKDRTKRIGVYNRTDNTHLPETGVRRTNNMFHAVSAVTGNMTHTMAFKWVNGLQELLIPGMIVEVYVERGDKVARGMGRLASIQSMCVARGNLASEPFFTETIIFSVHLDSMH